MSSILEAERGLKQNVQREHSAAPEREDLSEAVTKYFHVSRLPDAKYQDSFDSLHLEGDLKKQLENHVLFLDSIRRVPRHRGGPGGLGVLCGPTGSGKSTAAGGMANLYSEAGKRKDGKSTLLLRAKASAWFDHFLGNTPKYITEAFAILMLLSKQRRIVLILDEVDSVATSRAHLSEGDPTDVHRGVNSLLTALDELEDVLILGTSNQENMIDSAVLDRADNVWYVGYPNAQAASLILQDTIAAFRSHGVMLSEDLVQPVVGAVYRDEQSSGRLSGRDLRRVFRMAICKFGTISLEPMHVECIARELAARRNGNANP